MLKRLHWFWISFLVIALDQGSKWLALQHLPFQEPVRLTRFFNLYLDYNIGAAFSFLGNANGWQVWLFAGIAAVISLYIMIYLLRTKAKPLAGTGLALILGGAIGNLIDRFMHRYVIDFISWHAGAYYWPTFNIADSAVCVGAALLLWSISRESQ